MFDDVADRAIIDRLLKEVAGHDSAGSRQPGKPAGAEGHRPSNRSNDGSAYEKAQPGKSAAEVDGGTSEGNRRRDSRSSGENRNDSGADKTRNTESEQIKSAEPVVYDDSGKIIPLSERFNPKKKNIRFSREQKQEVNPYGQDGKAEDHASFIRRMHEGSRRVKQIGKTVFAYEPARAIDTSGAVSDAARELRRLGIKCFLHNGLEYNQDGYTYQD